MGEFPEGGPVRIEVKKVRTSAQLPRYMSPEAAGMDFFACLDTPTTLEPGEWKAIPTGVALALPPGWEIQIRPRSGLALKHGVTLLNSPGTIDSDYRGEIKIILINLGKEPFTIQPHMRIAQGILAPVARGELEEVKDLPPSSRGEGGFGHTGLL